MRQLIGRLIQASVVIGLLAMFSYASGLHNMVRMKAPAAGAWWNAHEFYFMEGSATALGLLVALRVGVRFAAEAASIRYLAPVTLALEAAVADATDSSVRAGRAYWRRRRRDSRADPDGRLRRFRERKDA